jgi:3D (Asp-Asp-Asp) domain-containing protein
MLLIAAALAVSSLLHDLATPLVSGAADVLQATDVFDIGAGTGPRLEARLPDATPPWVAAHVETSIWSSADDDAEEVGHALQWAPLQIAGPGRHARLPVSDPSGGPSGWVSAADVGPIDPSLLGTAYLPPVGHRVAWSGDARITMYTCVELGGCSATASGLWPEPGMVAVDPSVIPLGSTVWVQGLGTFLAADTGSMVRGAHLDVFSQSYADALAWGVQQRSVFVFAPE